MFRLFTYIFFLLTLVGINKAFSTYQIKKPTIILDAGHGGSDKGAKIKRPFLEEKRLTLPVALLTKRYLIRHDYKVILIRDKDCYIPPKKRADIANNLNAELFVSIHFNSCPNKIAQGVEVYFHNTRENKSKAFSSQKLAQCVLDKISKNTKACSRGVKRGEFCVIKDTKMPAILVEGGFLTNPLERDNIRKGLYQDKIALGIAEGIDNFVKTLSKKNK